MESPTRIGPAQNATLRESIPVNPAGERNSWLDYFSEYKAKHSENRLKNEGNVAKARQFYLENEPSNLKFMLEGRYLWMNDYIRPGDRCIEVGCGSGLSKEFIRKDCHLLLTDFATYPWVEQNVDALNTGMPDESFDVLLCSNMVHHVPYPKVFFEEVFRILKPNGKLLIQEINCSWFLRLLLRSMRHEGWSFNQDPFSMTVPCTDKDDLWSANCAIPNLLFDDLDQFHRQVPQFKVTFHEYSEAILLPLSGGVIAKAKTVNLPRRVLSMVQAFDNLLIGISPNLFALQRKIVLEKR